MTRRFRVVDLWADDDPAITRMREGLALKPPEDSPQAAQDAPGRPEPAPVESDTTPEPVAAPEESRRGRVSELVERIQNGDLSAVDLLRRLLDRS